MAQTKAASEALEALESTVNTILMHTGSIFADPSACDPNRLARTNIQLKQAMPLALSRFHNALDELEGELVRAKAVIKLDVASAKQVLSRSRSNNLPPSEPLVDEISKESNDDTAMVDVAPTVEEPSNSMDTIASEGTFEVLANEQPPQFHDATVDLTSNDESAEDVNAANDDQQGDRKIPGTTAQDTAEMASNSDSLQPVSNETAATDGDAQDTQNAMSDEKTGQGSSEAESADVAGETLPSKQDLDNPQDDTTTNPQDSIESTAGDANVNPLLQGIEVYADGKDEPFDGITEELLDNINDDHDFGHLHNFGNDGEPDQPDYGGAEYTSDFMQFDSNLDDLFQFGDPVNDEAAPDGQLPEFDESFFNLDL